MDYFFKRAFAYLLDMLLVSFMISNIASSDVVNFQLKEFKSLYKDYSSLIRTYSEQTNNDIKTCDEFGKAINKKKITEEEYVNRYQEIKDDKEILEEEFDSKCEIIIKDYNSHKMSEKDFKKQLNHYYYYLERNSTVQYILNIVICLLYFVLFQGFTGGQTLGKKLMRIKIVSDDDNEVSFKQLLIRTLFLYGIIYVALLTISPYLVGKNDLPGVNNILYYFNYVLMMTLIFTICYFKNRRGLHDVVAHTRVMMYDFKGNEVDTRLFWEKEEVKEKEESNSEKKNIKKKQKKR